MSLHEAALLSYKVKRDFFYLVRDFENNSRGVFHYIFFAKADFNQFLNNQNEAFRTISTRTKE